MPITSNGHPWGGERESAKMTGLRLPPPTEAFVNCPTCGQGTWFISRPRTRRANERRQGRWCWRSDVVQHRPCRPIRGLSAYTDSIETSTDNLTLHRGHRDDQCGSSSCLEPARTEPSGLSRGSGPGEGRPGSSGSGQGCPGSPGAVEDCPGSLRSVEGGPGSSGGCSLRSVEGGPGSSGSGQGGPGSSSGCSLCSGQGRSPILSKSFSTSELGLSHRLIPRDQAQFVLTTDSQATCLIPGHVAFSFAAFGSTSTGQEGDGGTRGRTRLEVAQSTSR